MTTTLQDRINRLQAATAQAPLLEQLMLHEPILSVAANTTTHPGASVTFVVVFESRRQAILKPFGGQNANACANYQQDMDECLTHEVVAWRLAHALGDPFDQLLPTAVLRDVPGAGPGVLVNFREGGPDPVVLSEAPAQVHATAFWDAVIGQQDRHAANFRYDRAAKRLAAIDSAFAFARPGDFINNGSFFIEYRHATSGSALDHDERAALQELVDHDLYGVREFLAGDRGDALKYRVERMLASGLLPASGDF